MVSLKILPLIFLSLAPLVNAAAGWSWLNGELRELESQQKDVEGRLASLPAMPLPQVHERAGFHSGQALATDSVRWVQVDLGTEMPLDAVVVIPAVLSGSEAYGFPRRFRVDASNDPLFAESVTLFDHTHQNAAPSLAPWHMAVKEVRARYVRFTATKLATQPGTPSRAMFALGEMLVFSGGRNVALGCAVEAAKAVETLPTWSPRNLVDGTHALGLPVVPDGERSNGWHSAISPVPDAVKWVEVDFGAVREVDEIRLIPAHPSDYADRFGFGFPRRFKVEADGQMIFERTDADFPNPGDTPIAIPTPGLQAKNIRITATRLWERSGDFVFALAELQAFHAGENIAPGDVVTSFDETVTGQWRGEHLVDGLTSSGRLFLEKDWLAALSERRGLLAELAQISTATTAAVEVAQERAWWLAGVLLLAAVAIVWLFLLRLRRARHLEMESLRQRISRDLHDEIGSHLGSIRLMSELALREGGDDESLQEIHRLAGEAAESMRGIIWLVREGDAPRLTSLAEAMRQSAAALLKGVDWHLHVSEEDEAATASLEFHRQVFLLFREAVHNIARHARASHVTVELSWQNRRFHLRIEDDGCGFDAGSVGAGNGLANLRHRTGLVHGTLSIDSAAGNGTRITLEAPVS